MSKLQKNIVVCELIGSVASGKPEVRIGYRVTEAYNTVKWNIGQGLTKAEIEDAMEYHHVTVVIRGIAYADKL